MLGGDKVDGTLVAPGPAVYDWIYGGQGDDAIFGQAKSTTSYLFGDEGHDYIRGGDETINSNIWGGSGDDFIRPGSKSTTSTIKAGKGDDVIGELVVDAMGRIGVNRKYTDADMKIVNTETFEEKKAGEQSLGEEKFYGEQGHDKIWLGG